jgi:hypothetical protein
MVNVSTVLLNSSDIYGRAMKVMKKRGDIEVTVGYPTGAQFMVLIRSLFRLGTTTRLHMRSVWIFTCAIGISCSISTSMNGVGPSMSGVRSYPELLFQNAQPATKSTGVIARALIRMLSVSCYRLGTKWSRKLTLRQYVGHVRQANLCPNSSAAAKLSREP